jgi:hypothetical protein
MNLTKRRNKTPGNDEEAVKPGASSEPAGASGGDKVELVSLKKGERWAEMRKKLGLST